MGTNWARAGHELGTGEGAIMAEQEKLDQGLRKLPSGKYQIRHTDPEGLRRSGGTFRHKRDALRALGRIDDSIRAGTWKPLAEAQEGGPDPRRVTLREHSELMRKREEMGIEF